MPYIKKNDRLKFGDCINALGKNPFETKGELEYLIYSLMHIYMEDREKNYSNLHDTVYAAQHCADEFRRRELDRREDQAIRKNGDIDK